MASPHELLNLNSGINALGNKNDKTLFNRGTQPPILAEQYCFKQAEQTPCKKSQFYKLQVSQKQQAIKKEVNARLSNDALNQKLMNAKRPSEVGNNRNIEISIVNAPISLTNNNQ